MSAAKTLMEVTILPRKLEDCEVYEHSNQVVILGEPDTEGLSEDEAVERHNCDVMGCGTHHVIFRFHKEGYPAAVNWLRKLAEAQASLLVAYRLGRGRAKAADRVTEAKEELKALGIEGDW